MLLPLFGVIFGVLKRLQKELMGVTEKRVKLLKRQEKKREKLERVGVGKKKVDSDEESEAED